jgi:hypothetical protein
VSNEIDKKIRRGLPPKREAECFQALRDIVIPAGTILRGVGGDDFACGVGLAPGMAGEFSITVKPGTVIPQSFPLKRVVSA